MQEAVADQWVAARHSVMVVASEFCRTLGEGLELARLFTFQWRVASGAELLRHGNSQARAKQRSSRRRALVLRADHGQFAAGAWGRLNTGAVVGQGSECCQLEYGAEWVPKGASHTSLQPNREPPWGGAPQGAVRAAPIEFFSLHMGRSTPVWYTCSLII
jgi:hypothetical protein